MAKKSTFDHQHAQFIQNIVDRIPALVVVYNVKTGQYVYANEAVKELLGYDKRTIVTGGFPFVSSLVHPDDVQKIMVENATALKREDAKKGRNKTKGTVVTFEYRMKHKNGSWRWLHSDGVVFDRDEKGKILHVMNISVDITARKELEIESEQQYRRLIDTSPMPTAIHLAGTILYANLQAALLVGLKSASDLIGKNVMQYVHPDYRDVVKKRVETVYKRKSKHTDIIEEKFVRVDGEIIDVEVSSLLVKFDGKDAIQVLVRDITEKKRAVEQLKHSKNQLEAIVQGVADGITMQDDKGKLLFANEAVAKLSGYSSAQAMLDAPPLEFLQKVRLEKENGEPFPLENLPGRRALQGEKNPEATIKAIHTKTGIVQWTLVKARPIFGGNKRPKYAINILHDITQLKLAEHALKEKEEKFRDMADNTPGLIWISDSSGVCTYLNKQWLEYTGKPLKRKGGGFTWIPIIHPDDAKRATVLFMQANERQIPFTMTYRMRRRDGLYHWVQDSGNPKFSDKNKFEGYIGSVIDIHEQKMAEEALRESEEKYRLVVENSQDIVMVTKLDSTIIYLSPSNERILGYRPEERIGRKANDDIHPDDIERVRSESLKAMQTGLGKLSNLRVRHKEGHYLIMEATGALVRSKIDDSVMYVAIIRDTTDRVRLERQKDEFIGIASHELKTPVTSIKAYAQVLQNRFAKEGNKQSALLLAKMNNQLDRLTNLIMDLLDVTKIETGKLQMKEEYFDFNELISEITEEMQRLTDTHKIVMKLGRTKTVRGDRERIGQVLTNFLSNAIKYSPGSSRIVVNTASSRSEISASVQDFGLGITKESQRKLFERFFRGETQEQQSYPGLGLGLYISKEIIRRHSGSVAVQSGKGKGSTFSFTLPVSNKKK